MHPSFIYSIIYALAARDGREEVLFGQCAPLARQAFERSLAADTFPELWFELPLTGEPWFDLHALVSREDLEPGMTFTPEQTGGWPEVFEWFACAEGVRQLALSYDVSSGSIEQPAIQLLSGRRDADTVCAFLAAAGRADLGPAYRAFLKRLPEEWFACYTGVFPARGGLEPTAAGTPASAPHPWFRVECIPPEDLQFAYAADAALLKSHLQQVGLAGVNNELVACCQELARTPFQLEFQFNVMPDGSPIQTFSASLRFASPSDDGPWETFASDAAVELMRKIESWGLADSRWQLLAQTTFSKRLGRDGEEFLVFCIPTFVKLRWHAGQILDAKAYLIAGVQTER